ncbi:olfactory receptor 1019-like [Spea bombifrons]|uniref:olfactory receptor 1019-like n=1 Tax=Spea bombifrons TaxID=233779 RepID=UPI0023495721|nr:olfactory receptor 1019-like [Spea bombifrons]
MKSEDKQNITGFVIQGLTDIPEIQSLIFLIFLLCYVIIFLGNLTIFVVILSDSRLHTPMYIFLLNLSLTDIGNITNILPKILNILLTQHKTISFVGCLTQMYMFLSLALTEAVILTAMAYDRYVAICHPLHYFIFMSLRHTAILVVSSWTFGFLVPTGYPVLISKHLFCRSHLLDHIICDLTLLLKISCSDTFNVELLIYLQGAIISVPAFVFTFISYIFIFSSVLKIQSSESRQKTFSTCTSHLTCVTVFYGTLLCLYMRPASSFSPKQDKFFALLYIIMIPILNPVIYTLKNQDVKNALTKLMNKHLCFTAHESNK